MQETLLGRDRYHHAAISQQDRLAQLQIPVAQGQRLAFECSQLKIRSLEERGDGFRIARVRACGGFADHPRGGPRLHVERRHVPRVELQETVLQLDGAPLIVRRIPTGRNQTGGARDGAGVPGAIRQIGREYFAFVSCDEHVIGRCLLGENRHLALDQGDAAVGAARAAGILEHALLHDLGAEAGG